MSDLLREVLESVIRKHGERCIVWHDRLIDGISIRTVEPQGLGGLLFIHDGREEVTREREALDTSECFGPEGQTVTRRDLTISGASVLLIARFGSTGVFERLEAHVSRQADPATVSTLIEKFKGTARL